MTRTLIVIALFAMVLLAYAGMRQGWTRRVSAQSDIAAPHALIAAPLLEGPWFGTYLGATHSGDWLERIAVHTLGAKSHAEVTRTTEGINIVREGERSFSIPNAEARGSTRRQGHCRSCLRRRWHRGLCFPPWRNCD